MLCVLRERSKQQGNDDNEGQAIKCYYECKIQRMCPPFFARNYAMAALLSSSSKEKQSEEETEEYDFRVLVEGYQPPTVPLTFREELAIVVRTVKRACLHLFNLACFIAWFVLMFYARMISMSYTQQVYTAAQELMPAFIVSRMEVSHVSSFLEGLPCIIVCGCIYVIQTRIMSFLASIY